MALKCQIFNANNIIKVGFNADQHATRATKSTTNYNHEHKWLQWKYIRSFLCILAYLFYILKTSQPLLVRTVFFYDLTLLFDLYIIFFYFVIPTCKIYF